MMKHTNRQFAAFAVLLLSLSVGAIAAASAPTEQLAVVTGLAVATASAMCLSQPSVLCVKTLELLSFSATAPGNGAAAAALSGDSLTIKHTAKSAEIVAWWGDHQTAGYQQLSFPSGHDTTRGLRMQMRVGSLFNVLPRGIGIEVQQGEQLSLTIKGSAFAGQVESGSMLISYDSLPGISGRGIEWAEFKRRYRKMTTVAFTLTGAAAGYTGSEALNAESDLLLPNSDYALIGAVSSAESCSLAIVGPDTGNLKIGLPCSDTDTNDTAEFFLELARTHGEAFIPVINSGNKANTLLSFVQDEVNLTPNVSLIFGLLA